MLGGLLWGVVCGVVAAPPGATPPDDRGLPPTCRDAAEGEAHRLEAELEAAKAQIARLATDAEGEEPFP